MALSLQTFVLLLIIASLVPPAFPSLHKVRHKHNMLQLRGTHVNQIREAFDEYRHVVRKNELKEFPKLASAGLNDYDEDDDTIWESVKLKAREDFVNSPSEYFVRNKRVHVSTTTTTQRTTTTLKSIDDYEDEYDDDNDTANQLLNDDAQAGLRRPNRDNSETEHQLAEGESLTDYKMKNLGTREEVQNSFQRELNQHRNQGQDVYHRIRQNIDRTRIEAMCRWPSKKVIPMQQYPSKTYLPQKYVIHQCSDDTACCGSSDKTCVAKKTEEVVLWFHVRHAMDSPSIENLRVINHTECECIYKNRPSPPRTTRLPMTTMSTTTKRPPCKCPSHFDASSSSSDADIEDETCGCVCHDSKIECRQRYEGKEGFNISDQRCILSNDCVQPQCLHGIYSSASGRCPDRNEKVNKGFQSSRMVRQSR